MMRRRKNKKGISPLLATVLLVAFVVIIAVLIWMWWANIVREQAEKEGQRTELRSICESQVDFNIKNVECDGNLIHVFLENKGSTGIDNFQTQLSDDSGGTFDQYIEQDMIEGGAVEVTIDTSVFSGFGTWEKIKVFPVVARGGSYKVCADQANEMEVDCS